MCVWRMIVIVVDMVTHNNHFKGDIVCCLCAISFATYNKTINACLISCDNKVDQEKWGCEWHNFNFSFFKRKQCVHATIFRQ
jgi:hypothetical protein